MYFVTLGVKNEAWKTRFLVQTTRLHKRVIFYHFDYLNNFIRCTEQYS